MKRLLLNAVSNIRLVFRYTVYIYLPIACNSGLSFIAVHVYFLYVYV